MNANSSSNARGHWSGIACLPHLRVWATRTLDSVDCSVMTETLRSHRPLRSHSGRLGGVTDKSTSARSGSWPARKEDSAVEIGAALREFL